MLPLFGLGRHDSRWFIRLSITPRGVSCSFLVQAFFVAPRRTAWRESAWPQESAAWRTSTAVDVGIGRRIDRPPTAPSPKPDRDRKSHQDQPADRGQHDGPGWLCYRSQARRGSLGLYRGGWLGDAPAVRLATFGLPAGGAVAAVCAQAGVEESLGAGRIGKRSAVVRLHKTTAGNR